MNLRRLFQIVGARELVAAPNEREALRLSGGRPVTPTLMARAADGSYGPPVGLEATDTVLVDTGPTTVGEILRIWNLG